MSTAQSELRSERDGEIFAYYPKYANYLPSFLTQHSQEEIGQRLATRIERGILRERVLIESILLALAFGTAIAGSIAVNDVQHRSSDAQPVVRKPRIEPGISTLGGQIKRIDQMTPTIIMVDGQPAIVNSSGWPDGKFRQSHENEKK